MKLEIEDVHLGPQEIDLSKPCDFICDIDGTIADLTHRRHWVANKPKNWAAFEKTMDEDKPIWSVISKVYSLFDYGFSVVFCSGRGDQQRQVTEDWLASHRLPSSTLYMRKEGDYRADSIIKSELYDQILVDGFNPQFVLDDRNQVVDMWRSRGLHCIQVAHGDF